MGNWGYNLYNPTYRGTPKTNMEPKHVALEDDARFQTGDFQVPAVSFRVCKL